MYFMWAVTISNFVSISTIKMPFLWQDRPYASCLSFAWDLPNDCWLVLKPGFQWRWISYGRFVRLIWQSGHLTKILSIPGSISHSFVVDTRRAESIISKTEELFFHSVADFGPTCETIRGSTAYSPPVLGFCPIPICISDSPPVMANFWSHIWTVLRWIKCSL